MIHKIFIDENNDTKDEYELLCPETDEEALYMNSIIDRIILRGQLIDYFIYGGK